MQAWRDRLAGCPIGSLARHVGEVGLAIEDGADGGDEVAGGVRLADVAMGPGAAHGVGELTGIVHGEDEDAGWDLALHHFACDFEAILAGHGEIEDDEVGLVFGDDIQGVDAVGGFGDDFEIGTVAKDETNALADDVVIVDDDYAPGHATSFASGS